MTLETIRTRYRSLQSKKVAKLRSVAVDESLGGHPATARQVISYPLSSSIPSIYRSNFFPIALIVIAVCLALWQLEAAPAMWWDEGWTLCDARSWVELNHYGCLVAGEPGPSTLSAAFPVVAPIALSFRLFGVGIWQARMVGVLFTAGSMALLYYLTDKLFNRPVAIATLVILLLMPQADLHPAFIGKQVLGEMPALFYLLAGYVLFFLTLRKSSWFLPLALLFWGVALKTKEQVMPFWVVSLIAPLAAVLVRRRWRATVLLADGLLGSFLAAQAVVAGRQHLLSEQAPSRAPVSGLGSVTALVPVSAIHWGALAFVLMYGLPILLGLGHATRKWARNFRKSDLNDAAQVVRMMMLTLAGSWLAWYVLFSAGWPRYLFPAVFIGSAFAASAFYDLTGGFRFLSTINQGALALRKKGSWQSVSKVIGAVVLLTLVSLTIVNAATFFGSYFGEGDSSVVQVTHFFNTATPADTLIETFDSELFLLLDRPYHHPPAQLTVALINRAYLGQDVSIEYDPLAADPDYLVVGSFSRWWRLYEPVIEAGAFRLHHTTGLYEIYERVR